VEVIVRLESWIYEETVKRVAASLVLRWFYRVYFRAVPTKATLIRWTLHEINDRVVQLAVQTKVTQGHKQRPDATCVQSEIHHPTRGSVHVLSRVVLRARGFHSSRFLCASRTGNASLIVVCFPVFDA
jgi:IS5 family transposase